MTALAVVAEGRDSELAMVVAFLTACERGGKLEVLQILGCDDIALAAVPAFLRDKSRAERAHDARDIGTDYVFARENFKAAKNGVIVERAALNHYIVPHKIRISELYYLVERVSHNRIGQSRAYVRDGRALLLRLLYARIHKHGTARAEVDGIFGFERLLRRLR